MSKGIDWSKESGKHWFNGEWRYLWKGKALATCSIDKLGEAWEYHCWEGAPEEPQGVIPRETMEDDVRKAMEREWCEWYGTDEDDPLPLFNGLNVWKLADDALLHCWEEWCGEHCEPGDSAPPRRLEKYRQIRRAYDAWQAADSATAAGMQHDNSLRPVERNSTWPAFAKDMRTLKSDLEAQLDRLTKLPDGALVSDDERKKRVQGIKAAHGLAFFLACDCSPSQLAPVITALTALHVTRERWKDDDNVAVVSVEASVGRVLYELVLPLLQGEDDSA